MESKCPLCAKGIPEVTQRESHRTPREEDHPGTTAKELRKQARNLHPFMDNHARGRRHRVQGAIATTCQPMHILVTGDRIPGKQH